MSEESHSLFDVYEHGIRWEADGKPASLRNIATTKLPIYNGFTLSILDFQANSLNERAAKLCTVKGPCSTADYFEEIDLRYSVLATLYHLNRILDLYIELTQLFERMHPLGTAIRGNIGDPRVFYEVDAFLGSARRVYESIRKVLWKHYRGPRERSRWSSIRKVLSSQNSVPENFLSTLLDSWKEIGEQLAAYRDCVAHYDPLTPGHTTCWIDLHDGRWGMTVKLPANPADQSRLSFDFTSGPEALTYCHSVACHLIELCELLESQPTIRAHLDNPPVD